MNGSGTPEDIKALALKYLTENRETVDIEKELSDQHADRSFINEVIDTVRKLKQSRRTRTGSLIVLAGVILLGIGFLLCVALHYSGHSMDLALYGITMVGALVMMTGLIFIFS